MLLSANDSLLMVVDIQERLLPVMNDAKKVIGGSERLMTAARILDVPVLASEQYPKGLGPTATSIASY
ncbi:MAG: hypothetical protein R3261_06715, partial [Alphaproteobacteria bacterium]|nr:hypothetical protein [Alphaproteobacteria bacterium]